MKKGILILTMCLGAMAAKAQDIQGRVTDEQGQALEYVNVVAYSLPDTVFVQGTVSNMEGSFTLSVPTNDEYLLRFSSIGYLTTERTAKAGDMGNVTLPTDTQMLDEVVVKANRPVHKLTNDGISTDIENTVLSKAGTAEDVLARIPGIIKKQDGYEVFGKGTPIIYINGREMRDSSELDRLKSEDIKSVEVITAPGARYDATVTSVIRIKTKAVQGEGFGFDVRSTYYQSQNSDWIEQLNYNYRHQKLDVFGTLRYTNVQNYSMQDLTMTVHADTLWEQSMKHEENWSSQTFQNVTGINYIFSDDHSAGMKYTLTASPAEDMHTMLYSNVLADGAYYDYLESAYSSREHDKPRHQLNAYYNGTVGKTSIDFNADYMFSGSNSSDMNDEHSREKESRVVTSFNQVRNRMLATKLVLTSPLWGGNVSYGAEYVNTHRKDDYTNVEALLPNSFSKLEEQRVAPFVEYGRNTPIGQLSAGVRYEHVKFDYYQNGKHLEEQSRSFDNLFPSVSLASQVGKVQMQLSYNVKTVRPSYYQLSNNVTYANRFALQTGNPLLRHRTMHSLSLTAMWKMVQLQASYTDNRNAIINWAEQMEENPAITLLSQKNIPSLKTAQVSVVVASRWGVWSPQLLAGLQKQWLELDTKQGILSLKKPIWLLQLNNAFDLGHGWVASIDMSYTGKGHAENVYAYKEVVNLNASLSKSFMNDRWSLQLRGSDLLYQNQNRYMLYNMQMQLRQCMKNDSREVSLTLRYKFNTTRSKYKGTGAGNEEKDRL